MEPIDERLVLRTRARDVEPDGLDGQRPFDERIERLVDSPHGPEAECAHDLEPPDGLGQLLG